MRPYERSPLPVPAAAVDAVCTNFHMMTRIADATGTPLDEMTDGPSSELRASLGLDDLVSARRAADRQ